MKNKIVALLAVAGCCFIVSDAWSQTAQVSGEVVSRSGQGVAGVAVKLVSSVDDRIGRKPEARPTDAKGNFRLPFDWAEVERAIQQGATWEVHFDKAGYAPLRVNLLLSPRKDPRVLKIEMMPTDERGGLMSKVDGCADPAADSTTLYVFDFASDMSTPERLRMFQQLLGFKLRKGIRADLESARLLTDRPFPFDIKLCREAPVRNEEDALFVGKRLGCPGVISGFIEEKSNQLKSMVRFTALLDPPLTEFAPVNFSSDLENLNEPNQKVNKAYLAFSSLVLGTLYLKEGQTSLAMQCFQHTKDIHPGSMMAEKAEEILASLQQASPARKLAPIGGAGP